MSVLLVYHIVEKIPIVEVLKTKFINIIETKNLNTNHRKYPGTIQQTILDI